MDASGAEAERAGVALARHGEGPPLALLHGLGSTGAVWHRLVAELDGRHRLLAPDIPGFGASSPAGPGFDLDQVADRLATALEAEARGSFALLGHSLGGAVALTLARRHPRLVAALILSSPAGFAPRSPTVARLAAALTDPAIAARRLIGAPLCGHALPRRLILANVCADPARLDPADARLILESSRGARRLGAAVAAIAAADLRPALAELGHPVGVIWGERDRIFPVATAAAIESAAPGVSVERIPGAGHVTQLERPRELAGAIERLLGRLRGSPEL